MGQNLKPLKPYMLKRWRVNMQPKPLSFFTCARPGRTGNPSTKTKPVPDETVHRWVLGLPGPKTALISLLGRKPDGTSEFSFYSFYGGFDSPSDREGCISFQEWFGKWHRDLAVVIREHPTYDFKPVPQDTLEAASNDINELSVAGRTVVLVDSGGVTRTGQVCQHIGAIEDSANEAP